MTREIIRVGIPRPAWLRLVFGGKASPVAPAPAPPLPRPEPVRDSDGRFVSSYRLAVRARCRQMLTDMGKDIPEVLR